jgi:hypothetical protein
MGFFALLLILPGIALAVLCSICCICAQRRYKYISVKIPHKKDKQKGQRITANKVARFKKLSFF